MLIAGNGEIFYKRDDRELARDTLRPAVARVTEAVAAWKNARPLLVGDLPEYRVLAEYNNIVLAARDDTGLGHGLHYVTWEYSYGRTGVHHGHYTGDFHAAKEDFAVRAGLIREEKLLTPEQAAVVRTAVAYRLENDYDILPAAEDALKTVAAKLDAAYPGPVVREYDIPEREIARPEMAEQELTLGL